MRDPQILAWEIKFPVHITIWHVDPEKDGTDDSCGWFKRARHGDKAVLEKIITRFEYDWDRTFTSDSGEDGNEVPRVYDCGYFRPDGLPHLSVHAIVLNLFFLAALEVFHGSRRKVDRFMRKKLFDILLFGENPFDSLSDGITCKFGNDIDRKDRIRQLAGCIYGWILRDIQPWWNHPRYHVHHFKLQVHCLQRLKRFLFSRCSKCGKGFAWGYSPISHQWDSDGPKWFKSERSVEHADCARPTDHCLAQCEDGPKT